jgi:phage terminase small subunit
VSKKPALTPKQKLFVANYLANGFNASKAARDAGYSEKTAAASGLENLEKPLIAEAIKKGCEAMLGDVEKLKVRWLQEVNAIAFSDFRNVARFNKYGVEVLNSEDIDDDTARAIESIESTTAVTASGHEIVNRKVKLYSKTKGLDTLGKFLGMLKEEQAQGVTIIINKDETNVL